MASDHHFKNSIILIKGAGEKASAVAHRLYQCGFGNIVMTENPFPEAERREVCFCEALIRGEKEVCSVYSQKSDISLEAIRNIWSQRRIAVLADPEMTVLPFLKPFLLIDAVMAKRNTGTSTHMAPLVIALGPGFEAGVDAHAVIETNPNSVDLGKVLTSGSAEKDTGIPTPVQDLTLERIVRAPAAGELSSSKRIGDAVRKGEEIASVNRRPVHAGVSGVIWGLVRDGIPVRKGQKIGDIDPRGIRDLCFKITPQARAVAGGVLEGILRFYT